MTILQKFFTIELTEKEKKLIEILRAIPYGKVEVFMENAQPVRIEQIKQSVKL